MKRIFAFLILLTLPLGFLMGAHKSVDALQDDVVITTSHVYGDPERVAGKKFTVLTTCGDHMWWFTDHTPGDPGETETNFYFSQEGHGYFDFETNWAEFTLQNTGGMGMSTSGGDGMEFADSGLGLIVNAVAERTLPGETREETLLLEDYYDYYPLEYWVSLTTEHYHVEEIYDSLRDGIYNDYGGDEAVRSYQLWNENFRFPIVPGDTMTVTVGKGENGGIWEIGLNMDGNDTVAIDFPSVPAEEGIYFSPVFQYWNGEAIETGEYVYGHGLYYIPFKAAEGVVAEEGSQVWGTFDFDALEMVYSMEKSDRLVAMEESEDGQHLHLLTREDGKYVYCLFDIASRELLSRTEILTSNQDFVWEFYPEQELLYMVNGSQMALVRTGTDSRVEFVADWPEGVDWVLPSAVCYEDGVLYGLELDWYEENRGVCLLACDEKGLGYLGYYFSNLNGQGYNSAWVNLEWAEFEED